MEQIDKDFLTQVFNRLASLEARLDTIERQLASLIPPEQAPDAADAASEAIDLDFIEPAAATEGLEAPEGMAARGHLNGRGPREERAGGMSAQREPRRSDNPSAADVPEPEEDLFGQEREQKQQKPRKTARKAAILDIHAGKEAWRHDIPGPAVKDIRSAITLNDRVLFIGSLFREDSILYQDTIVRINGMAKLDEAVAYLRETFPEWDMESDDVYRFMMAVRRKIKL